MNKTTNNTEKMQDFKNDIINDESSACAKAKVAEQPSIWERFKRVVSEEINDYKRAFNRIRTATEPIRRIVRFFSRCIGRAVNACVKLSIILIALMMLSTFLEANPEVTTSVSNFFEGAWSGVGSILMYFLNILKSIFAPIISLFS